MTAFDRSHYDYMMFKEYGIPDLSKLSQEERYDYEMEEQEKKESLIYMAEKLLPLVQAYIEAKHLPNYYNAFLAEITPFYENKKYYQQQKIWIASWCMFTENIWMLSMISAL